MPDDSRHCSTDQQDSLLELLGQFQPPADQEEKRLLLKRALLDLAEFEEGMQVGDKLLKRLSCIGASDASLPGKQTVVELETISHDCEDHGCLCD